MMDKRMVDAALKPARKSPRKNPCPVRRVPMVYCSVDGAEMDGIRKDSCPLPEMVLRQKENSTDPSFAGVKQSTANQANGEGCCASDRNCENEPEHNKTSVESHGCLDKKSKCKKIQTKCDKKNRRTGNKSSKKCGVNSGTKSQKSNKKQNLRSSKIHCPKKPVDVQGGMHSISACNAQHKVSSKDPVKQSVQVIKSKTCGSERSNGIDNIVVTSGRCVADAEHDNPSATAVASPELAVEDFCKLTAELTALNKDSERLTTPLHNKQTKRLQENRSPMKVLQKTPTKKSSCLPQTPGKQVFSPRNKKLRSPARLQVALFTNRTPKKTPRKTPKKGNGSQDESGLEMLSPDTSHLSRSPWTPAKSGTPVFHSPNLGSPLFKIIPAERSTPNENNRTADLTGSTSDSEEPGERSMRLLSDTVERLTSRLAAGSPMKPDLRQAVATPHTLCGISPVEPDMSAKSSQVHTDGKEVRFSLGDSGCEPTKPHRLKPSRIPTRGGERRDKSISHIQQKRKRSANSSDVHIMPKDKQRKLEMRLAGSGALTSAKRRLLMGEGDSVSTGDESSDETDVSLERGNVTSSTDATFTEKSTLSSLATSLNENDSGAEAASEDEGGMEIMEADAVFDLLDMQLQRTSEEVKLTAINVKSILRQVITNEAVLDMVRNTIAEEGIEDKLKEAMFEPKMTRSRIKQVLETNGTLPAWPLSPSKTKLTKGAPAFVEMTFNEDESDEDYDPSKEPEHLSDEESILSSQTSDFGSPASSNISLTPVPRANVTPKQLFCDMLGDEPRRGFRPLTSPMQLLSTTPESSTPGEGDVTIALRTRSKMPLDDTPLDIIEANFVAPDISADLYDTCCDNEDWLDFLKGLGKEELNETVDDVDSDPEYNFLADADQEQEDVEDYRNDKSVRVTKKELNELMNELFEAELDEEVERILTPQTPSEIMPPPSQTLLSKHKTVKELIEQTRKEREKKALPPEPPRPKHQIAAKPKPLPGVPIFSNEERLQLEDQMRKHTQLLTQTYILSTSSKDYKEAGDTSKKLLHELKSLSEQSVIPEGGCSAFRSANLDEALQLTTWTHPVPDHKRFREFSQAMRQLFGRQFTSLYKQVVTPTWEQMTVMLNSKMFMFPQMLPDACFLPQEKCASRRCLFSEAEDILLALGYDQFRDCGTHHYALQLLQRTTFPHKTFDRLKQRYRSILRGGECLAKNILLRKCPSGKLPHYTELEGQEEVLLPKHRDPTLLPNWFQAYEKVLEQENVQKQKKVEESTMKVFLKGAAMKSDLLPLERTAAWAKEQRQTAQKQRQTAKKQRQTTKKQRQTAKKQRQTAKEGQQTAKEHQQTAITKAVSLINCVPPDTRIPAEFVSTRFRTFLCVDGSNDSPGDTGSSSPSPPPPTPDAAHNPAQSSQPLSPASQSRSSCYSPVSVPPFEVCTPLHSPSFASCSSPATLGNEHMPSSPLTIGVENNTVTVPSTGANLVTGEPGMAVPSVGAPGLVLQTPVAATADDQWVLLPVMPPAGVTFAGPMPTSIRIPASMLTQAARQLMAAAVLPHTVATSQYLPGTSPGVLTAPSGGQAVSTGQPGVVTLPPVSAMLQGAGQIASVMSEGIAASAIGTSQVSTSQVAINESPSVAGGFGQNPPQMSGMPGDPSAVSDTGLHADAGRTPAGSDVGMSVDEAVRDLIGNQAAETTNTLVDKPVEPLLGPDLVPEDAEAEMASSKCPDEPMTVDESSRSASSSQQQKCYGSPLKLSKLIRTAWSLSDENSSVIGDMLCGARSATSSPIPALPPSWLPSEATGDPADVAQPDGNRARAAPVSTAPLVDSRIPTCRAGIMPPALACLVAAASSPRHFPEDSQPVDLSLCVEHTDPGPGSKPLPPSSSTLKTPQKLPDNDFLSPLRPCKPPGSAHKTPGKMADTPGKSAVEIMATMAQLLTTPPRRNLFNTPTRRSKPVLEESMSSKDSLSSCASSLNDSSCPFSPESNNSASGGFTSPSKHGFSTPTKNRLPTIIITPTKASPSALYSPKRYPLLAPKPNDSPVKVYSPLKRTSKSPRRQILQQQARAIAPKGLVLTSYVSPTKKAAANLTAKARRRGRPAYLKTATARNRRSDGNDSDGNCSGDEKENKRLAKVCDVSEDSDEDMGADSQTEGEDDQMAQLQAASSTIGFDPKKPHLDKEAERKKGKAAQRRETTLRLLDQNLLDSDPLRDERDTVFAQAYLLKAKDALASDVLKYDSLLKILFDFGKSTSSPVLLYQEVKVLLVDFPELVDDFAGFLQPEQALECDCLATHQEFNKAREFLRKLEVCFGRHPSYLQRILRAFATWQRMPGKCLSDLKELVLPLLRGQQHLLDEFTQFFDDDKPSESLMTDFEEVKMLDSDEEEECLREPDEFEEIEVPDGDDEFYGTRRCRCRCHVGHLDIKYRLRKMHCIACGMKVIKGKLYVQTSGKNLRPLRVVFRDSPLLNGGDSDLGVKNEVGSSEEGDIVALVRGDRDNKENEDTKTEEMDKKIRINLAALRSSLQEFVPLNNLVANAYCETLDVPVSLESVSVGGQPLAMSPTSATATNDADRVPDIDTEQVLQGRDQDSSSPSSSNSPDLPQLDGSGVKDTPRSHQPDHATDGEAESEAREWSMSDDKLLLETCREKGACSESCELVASKLQGRTVQQVECRLQELLSLITAGSTESDATDTETDTDAESVH